MRIVFAIAFCLALMPVAEARDTRQHFPIEDALTDPDQMPKLNSVKLYFGDQVYPGVARDRGVFTANKKTNAFNRSDKQACEWAFISAVISLQQRAVREGGDAVVDIVSVYKNGMLRSETEYECGAGALMAGVALRGRVVSLK